MMYLNKVNIQAIIYICLLFTISIFLLIDANTFSLYPADNITGREYGCYTIVENLIGAKSPSIIRTAEYFAAIVIFIFCLIFSSKAIKRKFIW